MLTVTSTQVDFVSGALLHQVTFNGNGAAFPPVLEEQLLATVQARTLRLLDGTRGDVTARRGGRAGRQAAAARPMGS